MMMGEGHVRAHVLTQGAVQEEDSGVLDPPSHLRVSHVCACRCVCVCTYVRVRRVMGEG